MSHPNRLEPAPSVHAGTEKLPSQLGSVGSATDHTTKLSRVSIKSTNTGRAVPSVALIEPPSRIATKRKSAPGIPLMVAVTDAVMLAENVAVPLCVAVVVAVLEPVGDDVGLAVELAVPDDVLEPLRLPVALDEAVPV
jgi:hypothetical protein